MKKTERIKFKGVWVLILLLSISILAWGLQHKYFAKKNVTPAKAISIAVKPQVYDQALLNKLKTLCQKYDTLKYMYTLSGMISTINKADSNSKMSKVDFVFCKNGNDFYYKLGPNVTLNGGGFYLYIDSQSKTIMMCAQKQVNFDPGLKSFSSIESSLRSEYYTMDSHISGANQTISLINEHHISCKQYSLTFDTLNLQLNHIYTRLTNLNDPLKKDNEKIVDVDIDEWDNKADLNKYVSKNDVIAMEQGQWKAAGQFANYQLIKMK